MRNGLMALLSANRGCGQFRAEATGGDEATIWLYDVIVRDDYWGGVSALTLGKALADYRDASVIHLRIASPGGDVFAGRAMEQLISEHPARIISHVDGFAASAASYVARSAPEVHISKGGMFMIHKAWTISFGNADQIRNDAELLDMIDETLIKTYAEKTGQDPDQLREWIAAETWMTAEQAVERGFADKIAGVEEAENEPAPENSVFAWDLSAYTCAPQQQRPQRNNRASSPPEDSIDRDHLLRGIEVAQL
jgi:ATP-dependent Clp protease protease subunit